MRLFSRLWLYHNTFFLLVSLGVLFWVSDTAVAHAFIARMGDFGYISAFITGFFFVSTFTIAPSAVLLFHLAQNLDPIPLALIAGAGSVLGDLVLFRFLKDRVFEELAPLAKRVGGSHLSFLIKTPYFAWFSPVLGALIIASPFPDELGVSFLGFSKISTLQFVVLTYILDTAGILAIVLLAQS